MGASNNFDMTTLQMLGRHDYDLHFNWSASLPNEFFHSIAPQFISTEKSQPVTTLGNIHSSNPNTFKIAEYQQLALDIITSHAAQNLNASPLRLIIQGTTGTRKSFLIDRIWNKLNISLNPKVYPLLVLAPIGVSTYNIQSTTIHVALCIPIQEYCPLTEHSLLMFQEQCKHFRYILIHEMSFLGP